MIARVIGIAAFGRSDGTAIAALSDTTSAREEALAAAAVAEVPCDYAAFILLHIPAWFGTVGAGLCGGDAVLPYCYCVGAGNVADGKDDAHLRGVFVTLFLTLYLGFVVCGGVSAACTVRVKSSKLKDRIKLVWHS
jgi:hypothetical protein